jgi:hypothetical protein
MFDAGVIWLREGMIIEKDYAGGRSVMHAKEEEVRGMSWRRNNGM